MIKTQEFFIVVCDTCGEMLPGGSDSDYAVFMDKDDAKEKVKEEYSDWSTVFARVESEDDQHYCALCEKKRLNDIENIKI